MAPPGNIKKSKGKERPPPIDQYMKPAIGIGLALLAWQFIKGIQSEIPRVNVQDELELRSVFFGEGVDGDLGTAGANASGDAAATAASDEAAKSAAGSGSGSGGKKNYVLLCHEEDTNIPISSVFQDAYNEAGKSLANTEFKLVDCNYKLPSEKTIAERFSLNMKHRPVVFVTGSSVEGNKPKQVPSKHLKTGSMLYKALKNLLEPKAEKIETTQDLRTKCLDKDVCGLLLKGSKNSPSYVKDAMNKLLNEYPKDVTFGVVDTSLLYVKNLEDLLPYEFQEGQPRFVVFQKVSGSVKTQKDDGNKSDRLKTSVAYLPTNGVSYGPMSNLVSSVLQKSAGMTKVTALPTIKTRTKKLVQEEQAKRKRKKEQQQRQNAGESGSTPGGMFTENDGSKEGRKAERDRRRAEHRKNNPNFKEKTPEELAEMERQRRKRMEEEAAKWNIAPEDAPEDPGAGGAGGDDYDDYMMDDEDDGTTVEDLDDDGDGDDDEDVLDLD